MVNGPIRQRVDYLAVDETGQVLSQAHDQGNSFSEKEICLRNIFKLLSLRARCDTALG